jgi:RHS repeat-associated protein
MSGNVVASYRYDEFGAIRSQTGSSANYWLFTGEQVDASGLQYLRARYYDQATGRFIGRDPIPFVNRYTYVRTNRPGRPVSAARNRA